MTLLTVDAKLMPILPLIARPNRSARWSWPSAWGRPTGRALIAGLGTDAVELVPSVPKMFGYYYDDADEVLADPNGRVVIADGRNHLELVDERFDIIVTDPPPPIQSSGVSVISSLEYYEAGRDHLTDGGVMMQWTPYGTSEADLKEHIRTFATRLPAGHRRPGIRRLRLLHARLDACRWPWIRMRSARSSSGPASSRTSRARSTRPTSTVDGWVAVIARPDLAGR